MITHRFAFTISGGLAMGAYEAGVFSQLYEDLAAVNKARLGCRLVIDALSGASAGSITGLILAQALAQGWPPAQFRERMWKAWVEGPDVSLLLQPADGPEEGIFTQDRLDETAHDTIDDLAPAGVPDLTQAVGLWMAITNTDGLPIRIPFQRENGDDTTLFALSYRDYLPYFVCGSDIRDVAVPTEELAQYPPLPPRSWWDGSPATTWESATQGALASASFPVAFRTKPLTRDLTRYGGYEQWKMPDWPDALTCQVMDGGIFGNEPIGKAIDAVAYLERLDPSRRGDQRTYLMIEPNPMTKADLGKAMKEVEARQTPDGLPLVTALVKIVSAYFNDALYSDFLSAQKINAQFQALDALGLDVSQKGAILAAVGLGNKQPVTLERIPHAVPTTDRLAGDFFGDFGGFLQQDFREMDFSVGQQEARIWLADWLARTAGTLGAAADALTGALAAAATPVPYRPDLSDASWSQHMTDERRNEIVNQGLDRLEQLLFRWLGIGRTGQMALELLRHVTGGEIHAALVHRAPAAGPAAPPSQGGPSS